MLFSPVWDPAMIEYEVYLNMTKPCVCNMCALKVYSENKIKPKTVFWTNVGKIVLIYF